jgi:hypothetical protein
MKKYTIRYSQKIETNNAEDSGLRAGKYYCEAEDEDDAIEQFNADVPDAFEVLEVIAREIPKER